MSYARYAFDRAKVVSSRPCGSLAMRHWPPTWSSVKVSFTETPSAAPVYAPWLSSVPASGAEKW